MNDIRMMNIDDFPPDMAAQLHADIAEAEAGYTHEQLEAGHRRGELQPA